MARGAGVETVSVAVWLLFMDGAEVEVEAEAEAEGTKASTEGISAGWFWMVVEIIRLRDRMREEER